MVVEHRTGDLFAQTDLDAIGHGTNTIGVMGSGIAPRFKATWPDMFLAYRDACRDGSLTVGGVLPWQAPSGVWIYNIASQANPGRDARLDAIRTGLTAALAHAQQVGVTSIGLPRIGAGIGGLRWHAVLGVISEVADDHPVRVVLVSLPDAR